MRSLYVQGCAELFSPAAIKNYRRHGILVARNVLPEALVSELTGACCAAAAERGLNVFPGMDKDHSGTVQFDTKMQPKTGATINEASAPPNVQRALKERDEKQVLERKTRKIYMTGKNQAQVDRIYRRLARQRDKYNALKKVPQFVTEEEEMTGKMSNARLREVQGKYQYDDVKRSFDEYRASGKMEREIRNDYHINSALEHIQNWSKCWSYLWPNSTDLQRVLFRKGGLGDIIGEAAANLSGEVVVRLFSDALNESVPFMNATPFHFVGTATNFRNVHAMTAIVGLPDRTGHGHKGASRLLVVPESHHIVCSLTRDGQELDRFQVTGVFDMGKMIRGTPEVAHLPVVEIPPLEPGSVLFLNNYVFSAVQPTMEGSASGLYVPPAARKVNNPHQYALSLMPDRCAFDGNRNSWASRDSHGPLAKYRPGQLLVDDAAFPVLHRALDIA